MEKWNPHPFGATLFAGLCRFSFLKKCSSGSFSHKWYISRTCKKLYMERSSQIIQFLAPPPFYHVEQGKEGEFDLPEGKITPQRLGDKEK